MPVRVTWVSRASIGGATDLSPGRDMTAGGRGDRPKLGSSEAGAGLAFIP